MALRCSALCAFLPIYLHFSHFPDVIHHFGEDGARLRILTPIAVTDD